MKLRIFYTLMLIAASAVLGISIYEIYPYVPDPSWGSVVMNTFSVLIFSFLIHHKE